MSRSLRFGPQKKAVGGNPTVIRKIHKNANSGKEKKQARFSNTTELISPLAMLEMLSIRYQHAGLRLAVYCPFHKNGEERNPSLSMDTHDGHYKCFACGKKGGDVIAFYRAVTRAGFAEALQTLAVHHG